MALFNNNPIMNYVVNQTVAGPGRPKTDPRFASGAGKVFGAIDAGLLMPHVVHFDALFRNLPHELPDMATVDVGIPFHSFFFQNLGECSFSGDNLPF